jgi:hypothetical protein
MTISFARAPPDGVAPSATLCQHAGVALTRALESARFRMAEVSILFVSVCHRPTLKEYHDTLLILKHDGTSMCLLATSLRSVPRRKVSRFPLSSASAALHRFAGEVPSQNRFLLML